MLARGIRSYHRPTRLEDALRLIAQGAVPLAGGTRLLSAPREVPNVVDLAALELSRIESDDGDLSLGAGATLQEVLELPLAYEATAGLLPEACRAHSSSRMLRGMATVGGESIHAASDSDVVAALLALNAVYVIVHGGSEGPMEVPALRFVKEPTKDLGTTGLLVSITIPGRPDGAALERVAVLPSAPSLVSVAAAVAFSGDRIARGRVAVTGLEGPPVRATEAEARLEATTGDALTLREAAAHLARLPFRDDAHASAAYRRRVAPVLAARALSRAVAQARAHGTAPVPRCRPAATSRRMTELPYFTSGRMDLQVNGRSVAAQVEARTTLLDMLRREGLYGTKHGCETGECGACTVLLDGRPILACLTLALRAHGRSVVTVEGLGNPDALHPIQQAFVDEGAIQCGYCTPAMELAAKSLLDSIMDPTETEVRDALAGCLCRCTGYVKPVAAVLRAARALRGE